MRDLVLAEDGPKLADWGQVVTGAASVLVAGLAFVIAWRQWRASERLERERPARDGIDRFFSEPLAEVRFSMFDLLNEIARAAQGASGPYFDMLRREFDVDRTTSNLPARYELTLRWSREPAPDEESQAVRDQFERNAAIVCATFDAILRAAEGSREARAHVRTRMGRLLVWWCSIGPEHSIIRAVSPLPNSSDSRTSPTATPRTLHATRTRPSSVRSHYGTKSSGEALSTTT